MKVDKVGAEVGRGKMSISDLFVQNGMFKGI